MKNGVKHLFMGFFKKAHHPPEHLEVLRLQVGHKVLLGIPFFKKKEPIPIADTLAEIAAPAPLLHPYGAGQRGNRLRQLHALLGSGFHSYDEEDHDNVTANGLPKAEGK
jgi:hypothetical protein